MTGRAHKWCVALREEKLEHRVIRRGILGAGRQQRNEIRNDDRIDDFGARVPEFGHGLVEHRFDFLEIVGVGLGFVSHRLADDAEKRFALEGILHLQVQHE